MSHPSVTVAMAMYNSARFVREAVESVLAQTYTDFEFLIVDDGSTDGGGDIVAELAATDSRITLLRQENRGIVASVNRLIDLARAPLIARMDSDDVCLPERFERQVAYMRDHPEVVALGTQFIEIDERGWWRDRSETYPTEPHDVRSALRFTQPIGNPTAMLRTDAVRRVGGYRPAFRYCEDYDLYLRLSCVGDIANLPDVLFHYRRTAGQMSTAQNRMQTRQAVKARFAHDEVLAGRPDPLEGLETMPALAEFDALFGRPGVADAIRGEQARRLLYSEEALRGEEFALIRDHAATGGPLPGGWRTVARCVRLGLHGRAWRLSRALLRGRQARRSRAMKNPSSPPASDSMPGSVRTHPDA